MYAHKILHYDPRLESPVVSELTEQIPYMKKVAVQTKQAAYRIDCMHGAKHPLSIESENYILVTIGTAHMDTVLQAQSPNYGGYSTFSQPELEFIASVQHRPEVEWAVDNSFDGLYIAKEDDYATFGTMYKFAVYMKADQATFWKLKFSGR